MGCLNSVERTPSVPTLLNENSNAQVGFDDFRVLRAIGRGAFGKVCIVEKRDTKHMYAMKYMSKAACIEKDAVRNVLREMDILMRLDHNFLVNLWFTFQDEEDLFVVVDLLLGGDLRYHLQQGTKFSEEVVRIYVGEIAMALDYLKSHKIIHRDVKPDNLLLDNKGHVHLTDFNVATVLKDDNTLATSMSGTKPYMAPEVFKTTFGRTQGYSYGVDWWSLGISIFEIIRGKRPYHINYNTTLSDVIQLFESTCLVFPSSWSKDFKNLLRKLLHIDPKIRLDSAEKLKEFDMMQSTDWEALSNKELSLPFTPSKDHLNCDPTYELEEMIIEPKPLHKKKKRLAKQTSNKVESGQLEIKTPFQVKLDSLGKKFKPYNRERARKGLEENEEKVEVMPLKESESKKEEIVGENPVEKVEDQEETRKEKVEEERGVTEVENLGEEIRKVAAENDPEEQEQENEDENIDENEEHVLVQLDEKENFKPKTCAKIPRKMRNHIEIRNASWPMCVWRREMGAARRLSQEVRHEYDPDAL